MTSSVDDGRWDRTTEQFLHHKAFVAYTKSTLARLDEYATKNNEHAPSGAAAIHPSFNHYRTLLRMAYRDNIDLRLLISPSHAWHWEALRIKGAWSRFEHIKRMLVRINAEEADKAGKPAFALWDFSGYNDLSVEEVPAPNDEKEHMRWFWESVHYKKPLGDLVLDRVLDYHATGRVAPQDFGVKITPANIEEHLNNLQKGQKEWEEAHPRDVAEILHISEEYERSRPCCGAP